MQELHNGICRRDLVQGAQGSGHVYMNIMALKILDHLAEFCLGLHTVGAVYIPQFMKMLFTNADGIPQFINEM